MYEVLAYMKYANRYHADALVLKICNTKLGLQLNTKDIGRSHPIGEVKNGKISIITRFLSYRQRPQRHGIFTQEKAEGTS